MVPFIVVRYDGLIASYLGETASRLRKLFDYVHTRPCVLFFDEFDTIGKERGDLHETGEIKRVVSSLLLQIDDLPSYVAVITATNHPELLDRAVWRRFQLRFELPPPQVQQAEEYFEKAVSRLTFPLGVSATTLAEKLEGANFSELEDFLADVAQSVCPHRSRRGQQEESSRSSSSKGKAAFDRVRNPNPFCSHDATSPSPDFSSAC